MTKAYAQAYFDDFCRLFQINRNGSLRTTAKLMRDIEKWYNGSYVLISLITGIPLEPIAFNYDLGRGKISNRNANAVNVLHMYAVSYAVLLRMAFTLSRAVPAQYRPKLEIEEIDEVQVEDDDEEED